jgi:hypothetical protein
MPVDDPAVGAPILHPVRVTPYDTPPVTAAPLPSVSTTDVAPNGDALTLPAATTTPGVVLVSKKPDGYSIVMLLPYDIVVAQTNIIVTVASWKKARR